MRVGPGTRDTRALIYGSVLVGGILGVRYVVVPSIDAYVELRQRIGIEREALWRERSLVGAARTLGGEFESHSEWLLRSAPRLYGASASEPPDAMFLRYLEGAVASTGVSLASIREGSNGSQSPPEDDSSAADEVSGDDGELTVEITGSGAARLVRPMRSTLEGEGGFEDVLTLVAALETGPKTVVIEGLKLEATPTPPDLIERILFRIDVVGFALDTGTEQRGHRGPGDTRVEPPAGRSP